MNKESGRPSTVACLFRKRSPPTEQSEKSQHDYTGCSLPQGDSQSRENTPQSHASPRRIGAGDACSGGRRRRQRVNGEFRCLYGHPIVLIGAVRCAIKAAGRTNWVAGHAELDRPGQVGIANDDGRCAAIDSTLWRTSTKACPVAPTPGCSNVPRAKTICAYGQASSASAVPVAGDWGMSIAMTERLAAANLPPVCGRAAP